jgi:hypothetical protein
MLQHPRVIPETSVEILTSSVSYLAKTASTIASLPAEHASRTSLKGTQATARRASRIDLRR